MKFVFEEYGAGKPIVLMHAFPLSGKMWQPQIKTLVNAGCRVILPDFRGFGENKDFSDITLMEDLAEDIFALLSNLKIEKAIIGGLSLGGYVLFNLYRRFPENFAAMILADTNSSNDSEEKRKSRFGLIEKIERGGTRALTDNMLPNLISDFTKENNRDLVSVIEAQFSKVNPKAAIAALRGMAARKNHDELLEKIQVPALLIFGENDQVTNLEVAEKMHSKIKKPKLIKISNAGHYSNLEQPEQFNSALREFVETIEI